MSSREQLGGERAGSIEQRGEIAQLVEHTTENRGVPSSSLGLAISKDACTCAGFGAAGEAVRGALEGPF